MPISFTCPHCRSQTEVADQYAGITGPCAQCGQSVTIPGNSNPAYAAAQVAPSRSASSGVGIAVIAIAAVGVLLVCCGILAGLLIPAVSAARGAARNAACLNNLKQITIALHMYHDDYGEFPPAYTTDEQGNPLHSWRVLILPQIGEDDLYDQIDLTQPWDSPVNQIVADQMPEVYACPASSTGFNETSYMVIVGKNTAFQPGKGRKMSEFTDGTSMTILVVEAVDSAVNWMEPKDLQADQMSYVINGGPGEIGGDHKGGAANVGFADGAVRTLSEGDQQMVQDMTTINGGEFVAPPGEF